MNETVNNTFSFLPYIKPIHEWKYSAATYYKHILHLYLKKHPTGEAAKAKYARMVITNVIVSYINDIIEAANLDNIFTESSWDSLVSQI